MYSLAIILLCHKKRQNAATTLFHPPIYGLLTETEIYQAWVAKTKLVFSPFRFTCRWEAASSCEILGMSSLAREANEECLVSHYSDIRSGPNFGHTRVAHLHELLRFGYFLLEVILILNVAGHCDQAWASRRATFSCSYSNKDERCEPVKWKFSKFRSSIVISFKKQSPTYDKIICLNKYAL